MEPSARQQSVAWLAALAAAWLALAILGHRTRDPDSRLYAEMAARTAEAPAAGWIAPDFPPGWYMSGRFREHPVGLLAPAAPSHGSGTRPRRPRTRSTRSTSARPSSRFPLLAATARLPGFEARALAWLLQLLPIAFTYRVRANHEQALLLCLVVALVGTELVADAPHARFAVLTGAGARGDAAREGIFAVFGPLLCALWLVACRRDPGRAAGTLRAWAGLRSRRRGDGGHGARLRVALPGSRPASRWSRSTCRASRRRRRPAGRRARIISRRRRTSFSISAGFCGSRSR